MADSNSAIQDPNKSSPEETNGNVDDGRMSREPDVDSPRSITLKLPEVENYADAGDDEQEKAALREDADVQTPSESHQDNKGNIVLPSVDQLVLGDANVEGNGQKMGSNGYAESIILDGEEEEEDSTGFFLPRIEVNPLTNLGLNGGAPSSGELGGLLPTWNHEFESMVLCRKLRKEIIAENAHPKCFGSVGASGLSRVFTSGSFCPDMSSRSMAPKTNFNFPLVPPLEKAVGPVEKSKTIAHIQRSKGEVLPEIRTSKVSLFSRDGEHARNLVFVRNARMTRDDRAKSDLDAVQTRWLGKQAPADVMPRLVERNGVAQQSRKTRDAAATRSKAVANKEGSKVPVAESESDELTPSEAGIMGVKINDWFTTRDLPKDKNPKPKTHHSVRNKRQSRNIWDPGIGKRIHRGLASSVFKSNACIGNYLNDVTASRFPEVEIRQIVFTR